MSSPFSTNLGKLWRSYFYCVGICGYENHSIRTAVGLLWSTLAHYIPWRALQYPDFIEHALYAVANSDPQVRHSGTVHSVALYDSAKPHFQTSSCHCLCEPISSVRHVCLRWDIKMDGVTICIMWCCCLKVLFSKSEHCNNDLVYCHCCL
jgi:hypothetical protein